MFGKKNLVEFIDDFSQDEQYKDNIAFWHTIDEKSYVFTLSN